MRFIQLITSRSSCLSMQIPGHCKVGTRERAGCKEAGPLCRTRVIRGGPRRGPAQVMAGGMVMGKGTLG